MTRNVLIAGAGPGVSGSLARLYAAEGATLALLGADEEVLATLAAEVAVAGGVAETAVVDLTDEAATRSVVTRLAEKLGHVDVLHFNPSAYREKDPLSLSVDELLADVRLGVGGLLPLLQAARPFMGPGGRVSATGSMAADSPWFGAASLGVQKAGLQNLVRSIDATVKGDGIRAASVTVRGMLAKEGPFAPDNVAKALRAAVDQDEASWQTEIAYVG
ncbi:MULTISPECIES: SDR family oxidoreductase [unclassified Nocardioides]|uniref:SDR family oxidoreductase n=1 Tax=unclassified Nocardioides TaxID=2615069 RepID=UPI0007025C42|nr:MULTISPECIES: SDR family oxidoreductase [unclassified Nocardioides]KRC50071.1 short-chain dehydrogenase [Nocardioides sp. Root79]KRC75538.1 short-chain dehydrogenase [Nocardioides sp. Root240]